MKYRLVCMTLSTEVVLKAGEEIAAVVTSGAIALPPANVNDQDPQSLGHTQFTNRLSLF